MTSQVDTATKVVRRFAEDNDISVSSRQMLWLSSAILNAASVAAANTAAQMFVRNDALDISDEKLADLVDAIISAPDDTGPFVSNR